MSVSSLFDAMITGREIVMRDVVAGDLVRAIPRSVGAIQDCSGDIDGRYWEVMTDNRVLTVRAFTN